MRRLYHIKRKVNNNNTNDSDDKNISFKVGWLYFVLKSSKNYFFPFFPKMEAASLVSYVREGHDGIYKATTMEARRKSTGMRRGR